MNKEKKVLHLVLKRKWWDLMLSGIKREEYRAYTEYWIKRLVKVILHDTTTDDDYPICRDDFTHVCFHLGYTNTTMEFEITDIFVGRGNTQLGAPSNKDVFIIRFK